MARGLFEIALDGQDVGVVKMEREVEARGELGDEFGIGEGCFTANAMLDVDDTEPEIPARSEFAQDVQQKHRIGAARHRDPDTLAGLEHAMKGREFGDAVEHAARMIARSGILNVAHVLLRAVFALLRTLLKAFTGV
jgi:hypothetical protein